MMIHWTLKKKNTWRYRNFEFLSFIFNSSAYKYTLFSHNIKVAALALCSSSFFGWRKGGRSAQCLASVFLSVQRNPFATGTRMADSLGPVGSRVTCPWIRLGLCMQSLNFWEQLLLTFSFFLSSFCSVLVTMLLSLGELLLFEVRLVCNNI